MRGHTQTDRIHIIGSPGSGKTTLAQELSAHLAIPWHELDVVAYEGGVGSKIPLEARLLSLQQIMAQPRWITEGAYLWWTEQLLDHAELIVWLDLPPYLNGWRIVQRHFQASWAGTNRHPGIKKLLRFLFFTMKKQSSRTAITPKAPDDDAATTPVATREILRGYTSKVVHCQRPADVANFKADFLKHGMVKSLPEWRP
jgi:adenylate kinase family enzyme